MASFSQFGNDLYTGKRSIDFIGRRRIWYIISGILVLIALVGPWLRGGYEFGIEFRGGSEFTVSQVATLDQNLATDAVNSSVSGANPRVSTLGQDSVRVQTDELDKTQTAEVQQALATAYDVPVDDVTTSFIGATWGADITTQAIRGLVIFLVLVAVFMAIYFRTWKMAAAALIALIHDLVITAGVYGLTGLEITPAAVIGFLTILGYSLYDTVVVFDKIRENTAALDERGTQTFSDMVNLAVNQTLVRSINTSVVAALPVASILIIGSFVLGASTLRDISLALLIGIIVGTYSTIFVAAPLYVQFRHKEAKIRKHDAQVETDRERAAKAAVSA
ncbi:protein translocase subunit SecF [Herbiconiux sp. KACC 21604]|uniref:protein translocase subunit SecF n=1 Tax=unclassified Herbiconiux TaxID=2618217 RepID=UPI0014920BB5|nr:protein translocase subunit SecF [Herbiconiux sp. SALV-R1]QJU53627.1 protein translocase subunit SecF [Herbiconiux sp. SALV-R1]WPO88611.1 protein translocase subunit SecF [Herbiconiux sp. KACC 21604]